MKLALITESCGLVGSESSIFFSKKNFKILGIEIIQENFFLEKMATYHGSRKILKKI